MIRYLNGVFSSKILPNERTLTIMLSDTEGTLLGENLYGIIREYNKYMSCVCFSGTTQEQHELVGLVKEIQKAGLKTCLQYNTDNIYSIGSNLLNELNYVILNDKVFMKDYSPFGDVEDWIDITQRKTTNV